MIVYIVVELEKTSVGEEFAQNDSILQELGRKFNSIRFNCFVQEIIEQLWFQLKE